MISARKLMGSMTLTAMALSLAACNTSGSTRLAGIGPNDGGGGSGSGGEGSGSGGGTGNNGGGTGTGGDGTGAGGGGTGGTGASGTGIGGALASLPIGSITGPGGVASTGTLPNVGQAGQPSPLAPVLVAAGNAALGLGSAHAGLAQVVNGVAPSLEPATDAVTQVLTNTGTALNNGASGKAPLVDGVAKAVAPVVTVALGGTTLVGDASGSSLVAVSAGSPAAGNGSLADLHLVKNSPLPAAGNLLGAQVAGTTLVQPSGTPAIDANVLSPNPPSASAIGVSVASGGKLVTVALPGVTNGAAAAPLANPLAAVGTILHH